MAIIPRFTSRALPPGAQPGLIKSAQRRGEAGAGLAKALGATIVAGVEFKKRKDLEAEAEAEAKAFRRALEDRPDGPDGVPRPPIRPTYRVSGQVADSGANLANKTDLEKQQSTDIDRQSDETLLASFEATMTQIRAGAQTAVMKRGGPAKNMTRLALAEFDSEVAKLAEGLVDRPHLKARFDALAASSRAPLELRVLRLENTRRVDEEKTGLADALAGLALAAGRDPAMAPGVSGRGLAQIEGAMKAGMLTPEDAAAMQQDFAAKVHEAAMRGQIAADPADAHARLTAGEFDDIFEAGTRDRLTGEARTAARTRAAQASAAARASRRGLEIDMAAHLEALAETGAGDEGLDARTQAELPPEEYAVFQASAAQARERFATRTEYAFMTAAEIEADIAQQASGGPGNIDPRDSDERPAGHAIRNETRDEILAARAADPAGWAMRDGTVAEAIAAAEAALEGAEPGTPEAAHAEREYRRALALRDALQREMGVGGPRLLSDAERDEIAEQLAQAAPAERLVLITGLRDRYGAHADRLAVELAGEVDASTALLLDHADMPHLLRLLAQGMEKAAKDGPAVLTMGRPEDAGLLPALPITDKGEYAGRKLDMGQLKPGQRYRAADGGVLLYDGEALIPVAVEIATPDPADPTAPTPPLPLGKASPPRETAVEGIALELDEQGNPLAVDGEEKNEADIDADIPALLTGLEEHETAPEADAEDTQSVVEEAAKDDGETASAQPSQADAQRKKQEAMTGWVKHATFDMDVPGGWNELPKLPNGRINLDGLESNRIYYVIGVDGTRTAWRWIGGKQRGFKPIRGKMDVAFSIDGMHELIGVQVRRTPDGRPIYNMEQDRRNAINWGVDAVFEIVDNPDADDNYRVLDRATWSYAKATVLENMETIERVAKEHNEQLAKEHKVDPQLVKAIMFREQAAGPVQPAADWLGISDTLSPMGFNPEVWHGLGIDRESASNSEDNIRAAVVLIGRIQDRITDPTPEKIATLYNGLMKEKISDYGALVGRYYNDSPWLREDDDPQP